MPNHASITIMGHLGKDPVTEQKGEYTTCRFSVAVTRKRKTGDLTTWYSITAWRKDAEYAGKYLKKGDAVFVQGEPYLDEWVAQDGTKKQTLKIEATRISSLSGRTATDSPKDVALSPRAVIAAADDDQPPF